MGTKKRNYSKTFKEKAVELSYVRDNIKDLAQELGIDVARIYKWRSNTINSTSIKSGKTVQKQELEEMKRLKKELKNTQLELEILKKAVHIFSKSDGKSINL
ncbi:transposase [Patescibacteria group bacterium]|nr:transposase [Patescibacteria group bacterium]